MKLPQKSLKNNETPKKHKTKTQKNSLCFVIFHCGLHFNQLYYENRMSRTPKMQSQPVLPTVGSPSDIRMIMETERGLISPWLDALTSIWTALISASLMLVPGVVNTEHVYIHQVLTAAACSPIMSYLHWVWCSGCTSWHLWPEWRSRVRGPRSSTVCCGWSRWRWSNRRWSGLPEWPAWPPRSAKKSGVKRILQPDHVAPAFYQGKSERDWLEGSKFRSHLLHLDAPHGPTDVNDKHNVLRERREVGRSEELDKMAVWDLEETSKTRGFDSKMFVDSWNIPLIHANNRCKHTSTVVN